MAALKPLNQTEQPIIKDLTAPGNIVVLVTPIDSAVPKRRLILPQLQIIRDIINGYAIAIVIRKDELNHLLANLGKKPKMVVMDSKVFAQIARDIPATIALTSFSILFARHKGILQTAVCGAKIIDSLKPGSRVLICEGCTHHRQ